MPTIEELLQILIDKQQAGNDNMQAGLNKMQTGIDKMLTSFNNLNSTFQKSLPAPVESFLNLEQIQEINNGVENFTFDFTILLPKEGKLSSIGSFLQHYNYNVEGNNDKFVRQLFGRLFPQNLSRYDSFIIGYVLLRSDTYTWKKVKRSSSMASSRLNANSEMSEYLKGINLDFSKLHKRKFREEDILTFYKDLFSVFKECILFGHEILGCILPIATKNDTEWFPETFTESDCTDRVRKSYLDNILSLLSILSSRRLSICQQRPLGSGSAPVTNVDISVMEDDMDYYVIEVKQYPLLDEEQESRDFAELEYNDFPERTKTSIQQLLSYEIRSGCGRGVLTDSFYYIFVEIDFEYRNNLPLNKRNDVSNLCPLEYYVLSCRSGLISVLQLLVQQIYQAVKKPLHSEVRKLFEKTIQHDPEDIGSSQSGSSMSGSSPTSQRTRFQTLISQGNTQKGTAKNKRDLEESPTSSRKKGRYKKGEKDAIAIDPEDLSLVSIGENSDKTSLGEISENTSSTETFSTANSKENLKDTLKIVLDPNTLEFLNKKQNPVRNYVYRTKARYLKDVLEDIVSEEEDVVIKIFASKDPNKYCNEKIAIEKLRKISKVNNCYLSHKYGVASVRKEEIRGPFLISRYIENSFYFPDNKLYEIRDQVQALFEHGILPRDITRENMIYNAKENKVYLIDFENAMIFDEGNRSNYKESLQYCMTYFYRVYDHYKVGGHIYLTERERKK